MKRALIVLCLFVHAAVADPDPQAQAKADALFEKAQAAFQAAQYPQAIELFTHAYELVHDPVYLFNLAQSYRKIFDCERAYEHYKRYLDAVPKAENRAKVEQWLRELQPCVDMRRKEREASEAREAQQHPTVVGTGDGQRDVKPPVRGVRVDHGRNLRLAGIAAGVVGVVGVGAGFAFSLRGASIRNDLETKCTPTCNWDDPAIAKLDSDGRSANTKAYVGYIGGGVALAAGAALYLVGRARFDYVFVTPAEHGASVSAQLRF